MQVRRSVILLVAALVVWTFVSYELVGMSSGSHGCHLLVQIPQGGFSNSVMPKLTQAEMDAQTAACSEPKPGDFLMPAVGYVLILGTGVAAAATAGKRDEPSRP
jgi:hypothetical protein